VQQQTQKSATNAALFADSIRRNSFAEVGGVFFMASVDALRPRLDPVLNNAMETSHLMAHLVRKYVRESAQAEKIFMKPFRCAYNERLACFLIPALQYFGADVSCVGSVCRKMSHARVP
jgi:hypothetical protein